MHIWFVWRNNNAGASENEFRLKAGCFRSGRNVKRFEFLRRREAPTEHPRAKPFQKIGRFSGHEPLMHEPEIGKTVKRSFECDQRQTLKDAPKLPFGEHSGRLSGESAPYV